MRPSKNIIAPKWISFQELIHFLFVPRKKDKKKQKNKKTLFQDLTPREASKNKGFMLTKNSWNMELLWGVS